MPSSGVRCACRAGWALRHGFTALRPPAVVSAASCCSRLSLKWVKQRCKSKGERFTDHRASTTVLHSTMGAFFLPLWSSQCEPMSSGRKERKKIKCSTSYWQNKWLLDFLKFKIETTLRANVLHENIYTYIYCYWGWNITLKWMSAVGVWKHKQAPGPGCCSQSLF